MKDDEDGEDDDDERSAARPTTGPDLARGEGLDESSDEEQAALSTPGDDSADDDESASDSSDGDSVTLGPSHLEPRRRSRRSPSIDLDETHVSAFPASSDAGAPSDDEDAVDPTRRLAVVNMDWDHLRAVDLYRVLASALSATATTTPASLPPPPPGGKVLFDERGEALVDGEAKGSGKVGSKLQVGRASCRERV